MDIDDIEDAVNKMRRIRFSKSDQLSLGQLIKSIEQVGLLSNNYEPKYVEYDFGHMRPTTLGSWRGSYNELAIGYTEEGNYDSMKAGQFLEMLKEAVGKTYEGYKGGDFEMTEDTPMWVANYRYADNTGVMGVIDKGYAIVLVTGYCEY